MDAGRLLVEQEQFGIDRRTLALAGRPTTAEKIAAQEQIARRSDGEIAASFAISPCRPDTGRCGDRSFGSHGFQPKAFGAPAGNRRSHETEKRIPVAILRLGLRARDARLSPSLRVPRRGMFRSRKPLIAQRRHTSFRWRAIA
jgi:hypothetical protein